jgi:endonuclease-8
VPVPEGDTLWRTARSLHAALARKVLVGLESPLPAVTGAARRLGVVGQTIVAVEARGKHLLLRFQGGAALHTHLGMRGSWRIARRASAAAPSPRGRVVVLTSDVAAACALAPVVELLSPDELARHPALVRLGPDLLAPGFDPATARRRLRERGDLPIGVALMDQTALAGIGNVYKSEVLFLGRVSPFARVRDLDDATLDRLVATAAELLRRNLGAGMRRTTSPLAPGRLWVYRRSGLPCRRCGAKVERRVQGEQARSTYFCPACQAGPVG